MSGLSRFSVHAAIVATTISLAACGGGSSVTVEDPAPTPEDPAPTPEEMLSSETAAIEAAIEAARAAVEGLTGASSDAEIAVADAAIIAADLAIRAAEHASANQIVDNAASLNAIRADRIAAQTAIDTHRERAQQRASDVARQVLDLETASAGLTAALAALSGQVATQPLVDVARRALARLNAAIEGAENVDDTSAYEAELSSATSLIEAASMALSDATAAEMAAEIVARNARAASLFTGLGPITDVNEDSSIDADDDMSLIRSIVALDIVYTVPSFPPSPPKLTVHAGTGDSPVPVPRSDTVVPDLYGWQGTEFVRTADGVTDRAVIYHNQDEPHEFRPIAEKWGATTADGGVADIIGDDGRIAQDSLSNSLYVGYIYSAEFPQGAGTRNHTSEDGQRVTVEGIFDSAPGTYNCEQASGTACSSTATADGITLAGGWDFTPADGAMTVDRAGYQFFGWWSREQGGEADMHRISGVGELKSSGDITTLQGSATYRGGAAGMYAFHYPASVHSHSGAFTARATLTADFGAADALGTVSGELTDFMVGGEAQDWTLSLQESDITATGNVTRTTDSTVWTINGNAGAAGGGWTAGLLETSDIGVPIGVNGQFRADYEGVGRMLGAFSAVHVDE